MVHCINVYNATSKTHVLWPSKTSSTTTLLVQSALTLQIPTIKSSKYSFRINLKMKKNKSNEWRINLQIFAHCEMLHLKESFLWSCKYHREMPDTRYQRSTLGKYHILVPLILLLKKGWDTMKQMKHFTYCEWSIGRLLCVFWVHAAMLNRGGVM